MEYWADTKYIEYKAWAVYKNNDTFKYLVNMELKTLVPGGNSVLVGIFHVFLAF